MRVKSGYILPTRSVSPVVPPSENSLFSVIFCVASRLIHNVDAITAASWGWIYIAGLNAQFQYSGYCISNFLNCLFTVYHYLHLLPNAHWLKYRQPWHYSPGRLCLFLIERTPLNVPYLHPMCLFFDYFLL